MAKPLGTEPAATGEQAQKRVLNICLVVEEGETAELAGNLKLLRRWIDPGTTELHLILTVPEVVDSRWFFSESRIFAETLVERQREVLEKADLLDNFMMREGFRVTNDGTGVMSDRGARQIIDDLQKQPADLLIVLSGTDSGFAHRLVAHAPCAALLLRDSRPGKAEERPARLLIGVDGTDSANLALEKLPDLIRTRPLQAALLTVINTAYFENSLAAPFVNIGAMETAMQENAAMIMDIAKGILQARGLEVTEEIVLDGPPAWTMAGQAKERDPDLVVAGAHNRGDLAAWMLGSVSWRLLQSDHHNLLIVR